MSMSAYQRGFERRRSDLDRLDKNTVKPTRVMGFDDITLGVAAVTVPPSEATSQFGESLYDVNFPVWFVEKPSMSFGAELDETQSPVTQAFPTVSVVVVRWHRAMEDRVGDGFWVGAQLAVVIGGPLTGIKMTVHWQAEGKAIHNPSQPGDDLDTPL